MIFLAIAMQAKRESETESFGIIMFAIYLTITILTAIFGLWYAYKTNNPTPIQHNTSFISWCNQNKGFAGWNNIQNVDECTMPNGQITYPN